ncbi:MAG: AMP-binding protein [Thiohalophilus sp.]|uniref:AMP-binding protein n=1 Tax=Thiohalophilus sp. TaxID=3028392 RepID=UPI0028700CF1|nr:AMP-binding protein [Thiohalophilus sp.]MDR9436329.1 AMP-binding protein [Thiohalophilus sp.]
MRTLLKIVFRALLRLLYRVEVQGLENLQQAGPRTLLIANHTSFLDALLLTVFLPRELSFAIHTRMVNQWFIRPFKPLVTLFVMDPTSPFSLKSLIRHMQDDHSVVLFPEGRITVTGALMKIYHGPGLVADKVDADVLPVRIDGAQYSPFSRLRKRIRVRWFPRITLTVLPPRKIKAPAEVRGRARRIYAGERLTDIMTEMMFATSHYRCTIFDALLDAQRIHGGRHKIAEDFERVPINYRQLIQRSFILADALAERTRRTENVGILLPNTTATLITLFALQIYQRVPALLNYSDGVKNLLEACRIGRINTIYTSRQFADYVHLHELLGELGRQVKVIYLEEVVSGLRWLHKLRGLFAAWFPRLGYRGRAGEAGPDDPAVLLFTPGSEAKPKGVVLSHANLLANCSQLVSRTDFSSRDVVLNTMPMFHAFGLTCGTVLPVISGVRVFFYPNPLHYRIVPEIAYDINATILFGTDTFLAGYARFAHPYDFYSIRYVFAGAEKLQASTRRMWSERFGVRIFEGYGATETSSLIAINTAMENRPGTVGRLLPGMDYRLVAEPGVEAGERLWVKGPNVMLGYLQPEQPDTLQPPATAAGQGWYDTGDIVSMNERGFLTIIGRVRRFARVDGETVSLAQIEEFVSRVWPHAMHAIIHVPDAGQGEQLVLITTRAQPQRRELLEAAREQGIPEVGLPHRLVSVPKLPQLGSGKIDYRQLQRQYGQPPEG